MTNVGTATPGKPTSIPALVGVFARVALQNTIWSWFDGRTATVFFGVGKKERTAAHAKYVGAVLDMIADGRITPVIGKVWAFEQAQEALIAIGKGGTHVGKQVVHISSA